MEHKKLRRVSVLSALVQKDTVELIVPVSGFVSLCLPTKIFEANFRLWEVGEPLKSGPIMKVDQPLTKLISCTPVIVMYLTSEAEHNLYICNVNTINIYIWRGLAGLPIQLHHNLSVVSCGFGSVGVYISRTRLHAIVFSHLTTDVDECTAGSNTCDNNAECHDTDGSYWCQCLPGFQGDGYNCTGQFATQYSACYCSLPPSSSPPGTNFRYQ